MLYEENVNVPDEDKPALELVTEARKERLNKDDPRAESWQEQKGPENPIPIPVATQTQTQTQTSDEIDPIVSDDDRRLVDKARKSVAGLQIEIKTVIGFTSDYLAEKYQVKDQKQFDRLFGSF